jgi:hypothetical protein
MTSSRVLKIIKNVKNFSLISRVKEERAMSSEMIIKIIRKIMSRRGNSICKIFCNINKIVIKMVRNIGTVSNESVIMTKEIWRSLRRFSIQKRIDNVPSFFDVIFAKKKERL